MRVESAPAASRCIELEGFTFPGWLAGRQRAGDAQSESCWRV